MRKGGEAGLTTRPAATPNYAPDGITQGVVAQDVVAQGAGSRQRLHRPHCGTSR